MRNTGAITCSAPSCEDASGAPCSVRTEVDFEVFDGVSQWINDGLKMVQGSTAIWQKKTGPPQKSGSNSIANIYDIDGSGEQTKRNSRV